MEHIEPNDLPAFLDPLLDYLADHLPASLYDSIFTALSYGLLLASGAFRLITTLPSWKPWEWDAQRVLPPLISILAAYYTLLSMYRTTGWMVRMCFRFVKWSVILGILGASFGYLMGADGGQGGPFNLVWNALQGQDDRAGAPGRTGGRPQAARPHAWQPFNAHRQWQYNEQEARRLQEEEEMSDAQRMMHYVAGIAARVMGGAAYDVVAGARGFLDNIAEATTSNDAEREYGGVGEGRQRAAGATRKQPKRKAKTAAQRRTRSR